MGNSIHFILYIVIYTYIYCTRNINVFKIEEYQITASEKIYNKKINMIIIELQLKLPVPNFILFR